MTTLRELTGRWQARRAEWERLGVSVDGAKLAAEIVSDLEAIEHVHNAASVTLTEAHLIGGYSIDHLQRLVSSGQLQNLGRKGKPRIRRADVPIKPGRGLRDSTDDGSLDARRRIVASVLTGSEP
jgi:hypothetical protein